MALFTRKSEIREEVLSRRASLSMEVAATLGKSIQEKLLQLPEFLEAGKIALYSGRGREVTTELIFSRALELQKEVSFPRVDASTEHGSIRFFRVEDLDDLRTGLYGIKEPGGNGKEVLAREFDLIVAPGVAFDMSGARIGYGKGYYDRVLKDVGCPIAAIVYDIQIVDEEILTDAHDVDVTMIVTETKVMRF